MTKPIKLSICICSLHERHYSLVELLQTLTAQPRSDETEILISIDGGQAMRGPKRNALVQRAQGEYVVHIDDDDNVADDYISRIIHATRESPDAIAVRGVRTDIKGKQAALVFDYRVMAGDIALTEDSVLWRSPGHLCAVRRDIAQAVPFPETEPEDLDWVAQLAPHIKTVARASEHAIYFYQWDSEKVDRYNAGSKDADTSPFRRERPPIVEKPADHRLIFTPQYIEKSGPGSTVAFSEPYRWFVERFLREHPEIKTVIDLGCGDAVVASHINWQGRSYVGLDIIEDRIRLNRERYPSLSFACADIRYERPDCDLVIVKDVIQHWSNLEVQEWLWHFQRSPFRWALVTNCTYGASVNVDTASGDWRALDLTKAPFSVGERVFSWGIPNKDVVLLKGSK